MGTKEQAYGSCLKMGYPISPHLSVDHEFPYSMALGWVQKHHFQTKWAMGMVPPLGVEFPPSFIESMIKFPSITVDPSWFGMWYEPTIMGAFRAEGEVQEATLGVSEDWKHRGKEGPRVHGLQALSHERKNRSPVDGFFQGGQGGALVSCYPISYSYIMFFLYIYTYYIYIVFSLSLSLPEAVEFTISAIRGTTYSDVCCLTGTLHDYLTWMPCKVHQPVGILASKLWGNIIVQRLVFIHVGIGKPWRIKLGNWEFITPKCDFLPANMGIQPLKRKGNQQINISKQDQAGKRWI